MVQFKTNGKGTITAIIAASSDDVIIPAEINGEKIVAWTKENQSYDSIDCKSFSSDSKGIKISKGSFDGISASGNIDLRNFDFSDSSELAINLACDQLILPEQKDINRPMTIYIKANRIDLKYEFCENWHFELSRTNRRICNVNIVNTDFLGFQPFTISPYLSYNFFEVNIKKLNLLNGIMTISTNAFARMSINELNLPSTLISLEPYAFNYCFLGSFPKFNFKRTAIEPYSFANIRVENKSIIDLSTLKIIPVGLFEGARLFDAFFDVRPGIEIQKKGLFLDYESTASILPSSFNSSVINSTEYFRNIEFKEMSSVSESF